jgi:DNA polymerase-3 subunit gamma/tau
MTPVEVGERRRHELQAGAVAAIEQDPLVREIIETFDARIIENSIRPIQ